jgi:hypothetical protein
MSLASGAHGAATSSSAPLAQVMRLRHELVDVVVVAVVNAVDVS